MSAFHREVYGGGVNPLPVPGHEYTAEVLSVGVGGVYVRIPFGDSQAAADNLPSTSRGLFLPGASAQVGEIIRVRSVHDRMSAFTAAIC